MQPVLILGLDGGTWDLIRPWAAQGKLPTLARLMAGGVQGPMRSTMPPWTYLAWNSFMTGKNPGQHGVFDFFRPRPGTYDLEFVNGGTRRGSTFWQLLSEAGRRVVSISLPCTFPPERVHGVMISGFDFPGEGPGSAVDARGMYPPELYRELAREVGRHPIDPPILKEIERGRLDIALERILETIRQKAATARYLLQHRPWDCFMMVFGETDGSAHQFWKYGDPNSPLYTDQPPGLRDSILRIYQEVDRLFGEMLALAPTDAVVLVISDHGFGGVSNCVLFPNCWLRDRGFLRFRGPSAHRLSRLREMVKRWGVARLPGWLQRFLYRSAAGLLGRFEARARYGMIDWAGTEAYFDENPYFPALRINLKGRQPGGIVEPGQHYEEVRDRLIRELEAWRNPHSGAPIVARAYRREELYSGPCLEEAHDIIPQWALHKGYNYAFKLSSKSRDLVWMVELDPLRPEHRELWPSKSGTHREEAVFLAQGPMIPPGTTVEGVRIIDLAPTILHLLEVPVPDDMDGRVLEEVFTESFRQEHPVRRTPGRSSFGGADENSAYSSEDEAVIAARLKSLGYVE
ncbi:MAG: alkaline phosphatase family protein [Planctomycetes bacterium]|nr:alkaline phosphatase family protein [Planctomycetota bacterium]